MIDFLYDVTIVFIGCWLFFLSLLLVQKLIDELDDDRVILDQQVTDDQVAILSLGDKFLLEAIQDINTYNFAC